MDRFIKTFAAAEDGDLRLCERQGVAYQADMQAVIAYDDAYADHYAALEGTPIATALNAGRCALLARHAAEGATVLDIGAGCGTFVRAARSWGFPAKGFDVIPKTVDHLKSIDAFADNPAGFEVVTFWDSLEHMEDPGQVLDRVARNALVLVAIPLVQCLAAVRASKHYKPGEHLYHFTERGFVDWMALHGFSLLERSTHETDAGRESIGAFAFRKDLPICCGDVPALESFDWKGEPTKWFYRCFNCEAIGENSPTREGAVAAWHRSHKVPA